MFNLTKLSLLWEWVNDLKKKVGPSGENLLPSRSTATTGQILKLTGENKTPAWADEYSYTPPAYSETEVNTGQKWIDGKDIFEIVVAFDFPEITATTNVSITTLDINLFIISIDVFAKYTNDNEGFPALPKTYSYSAGTVSMNNVSVAYSEARGYCVIRYTKPDPTPETRDDDTPEEVKETKTKKKTTK